MNGNELVISYDEKWILIERYEMRNPTTYHFVFEKEGALFEIQVTEEIWEMFNNETIK